MNARIEGKIAMVIRNRQLLNEYGVVVKGWTKLILSLRILAVVLGLPFVMIAGSISSSPFTGPAFLTAVVYLFARNRGHGYVIRQRIGATGGLLITLGFFIAMGMDEFPNIPVLTVGCILTIAIWVGSIKLDDWLNPSKEPKD